MRVRIALNFKKVAFEEEFLDLLNGDQFSEHFKSINPQQVVPAVIVEGEKLPLFQSMAILEYLEETYPNPSLLPADAISRAWVRGMAQIIIADTHRNVVPSTRKYITETFGHTEAELIGWIHHWIGTGLSAFEKHLQMDGKSGNFCFGSQPGFADICLFPQILGAKRFKTPLNSYPTALRIFDNCMALDEFRKAVPG